MDVIYDIYSVCMPRVSEPIYSLLKWNKKFRPMPKNFVVLFISLFGMCVCTLTDLHFIEFQNIDIGSMKTMDLDL